MWAGGKNKHIKWRKNTMLEYAIPTLTNYDEHSQIVPTVPGHTTHSHSSGVQFDTHSSKAQFSPSFSISLFEMNHHACVSGSHFSQKVNAELFPLQCMCVCFSAKGGKSMRADNGKHRKCMPRPKIDVDFFSSLCTVKKKILPLYKAIEYAPFFLVYIQKIKNKKIKQENDGKKRCRAEHGPAVVASIQNLSYRWHRTSRPAPRH